MVGSREQRIKAEARRLGFCAAGIAPARPDAQAVRRLSGPRPPFVRWRAQYRLAPQMWLEGARAVVVVAFPYRDRYAATPSPPGPGEGYFSPFARRPDYHRLVRAKLEELGQFLVALAPDSKYVLQVDSGPGCERLFAWLAGVGWIGKNNFVIVPGYGSWVWLGLVTTTLALKPDQPIQDRCGQCQACLHACPSGAYAGANDFDHRRCMAYWAAEKGVIDHSRWLLLANHRIIYGCDYCQTVCPHNKGEAGPIEHPRLAELLGMSRRQLADWLAETAASWRGAKVIRRNLVIAAAGQPDLRQLLADIARGEDLAAKQAREILNQTAQHE